MDILSDWLQVVDTRGGLLARSKLMAPWGMALPATRDCLFHLLTEGRCWLRRAGEAPLELAAGDFVLLPGGDAHELVHEPAAEAEPLETLLTRLEQQAAGDRATLICGVYRSERAQPLPLLGSLPRVVHFRAAEVAGDAGLSASIGLLLEELDRPGPGGETLVPTLFQALLLYTLRAMGRRQGEQNRWMAALEDPALSLALQKIHAEPGADWTVQGLAEAAGLSRAVFAQRFTQALGEAPLTYLTNWRMHLAARRFAVGAPALVDVAEELGYRSEFSFSRAFKRKWGVAPTVYRRQAQAVAAR